MLLDVETLRGHPSGLDLIVEQSAPERLPLKLSPPGGSLSILGEFERRPSFI